MKTAKDIMSEKYAVVTKKSRLKNVIKKIAKDDISCILIIDKKKLVGIITQSDLIIKILLKNKKKATVAKVMNSNVLAALPDDDILTMQKLMGKNKIKHLPVIDGHFPIGIVKQEDIAREVHEIEAKNRTFLYYQNAQTIIIVAFLIFLAIFLFSRLAG